MKPFRVASAFVFAMLLSIIFASNVYTTNGAFFQAGHKTEQGFKVRQYDNFHDVLHPLQHEALPKKDFQRIRAKATLLSKRGRAILKLGVPRRTSAENRVEFKNELKKFKEALDRFALTLLWKQPAGPPFCLLPPRYFAPLQLSRLRASSRIARLPPDSPIAALAA